MACSPAPRPGGPTHIRHSELAIAASSCILAPVAKRDYHCVVPWPPRRLARQEPQFGWLEVIPRTTRYSSIAWNVDTSNLKALGGFAWTLVGRRRASTRTHTGILSMAAIPALDRNTTASGLRPWDSELEVTFVLSIPRPSRPSARRAATTSAGGAATGDVPLHSPGPKGRHTYGIASWQ